MAEPAPTTELIEALQGVLRQVAEPTHVLRLILEQAVSRTGAERGLFVEVTEYEVWHQPDVVCRRLRTVRNGKPTRTGR